MSSLPGYCADVLTKPSRPNVINEQPTTGGSAGGGHGGGHFQLLRVLTY